MVDVEGAVVECGRKVEYVKEVVVVRCLWIITTSGNIPRWRFEERHVAALDNVTSRRVVNAVRFTSGAIST